MEAKNEGKVELKKSITLLNAINMMIGIIIGSGIFIAPTDVLELSGSFGVSLIVWIICGLFATLGALCFAEIATTIPKSGGEFIYLMHMYGELPAFLYLWVNIVIIKPVSQAYLAIAFGRYIVSPFIETTCQSLSIMTPERATLELSSRLIGCACLLTLTAINCASVKLSTKVQDYLTYSKFFAILGLMGAAGSQIYKGKGDVFQDFFVGTSSPVNICLAIYNGLFAFSGWKSLNLVYEEIQNPFRNLLIANVIGLPLVTIVYILINISYILILSKDVVLSSNALAFDCVSYLFPKNTNYLFYSINIIMPLLVAMSSFGSAHGTLFTTGRLFYMGGQEGHLPLFVSMIHKKRLTPFCAIIIMSALSLPYVFVKGTKNLINYLSFTYYFIVASVIFGLIKMRFQKKSLERPIKLPIALHIFFLICCIILIVLPLWDKLLDAVVGYGILLTGIPVYFLFVKWKKKPAFVTSMSNSMTRFIQLIFEVVTVESPTNPPTNNAKEIKNGLELNIRF